MIPNSTELTNLAIEINDNLTKHKINNNVTLTFHVTKLVKVDEDYYYRNNPSADDNSFIYHLMATLSVNYGNIIFLNLHVMRMNYNN